MNSPAIAPSSIRWFPADANAVESRCPVCRELHHNAPVLAVGSLADGSTLTMYQCSACDSKFFDPPDIRDFSEITGRGDHFPKSYVEVVCGIWETFWPAGCASRKAHATLLDIGCGFGFSVDAWRRLRGEAIGVEMADYGRAGAKALGVPIYSDYLENIPELESRCFDVVYASEVIEHVPDPRAFATLLARHVAGDGVLCLTTPNASFIRERNVSSTLLAALSPGFHGFLIGPVAMEDILRACGFAHVSVREFGERLVGWASHRPLDVDPQSPAVRAQYLDYLESVLASRAENDSITDGIAYRHFRDTVLAGQFDAARRSLQRLETSLGEKYRADVLHPVRARELVQSLASVDEFSAACPWFLPNFYFLRGMYAKLVERDEEGARQCFRTSREVTTFLSRSWGDMLVLEALSFLPEAWQQEAVSAAGQGDSSVCVEWMASIANGGPDIVAAFGGSRPSDHQIERAFVEGLSLLGSLNRREALREALHDCLSYLDNTYGDWLRAAPTVREKLPGAALQLEQQMLLHLKIAAACTQVGLRTDLVRPLLERAALLAQLQDPQSPMTRSVAAEARARLAAPSPGFNPWGTANQGMKISYSFQTGSKPPTRP